ncbi:hypothetical protein PTKIN_Ptkin16aG0508000 [Pterospermum kingtungense]
MQHIRIPSTNSHVIDTQEELERLLSKELKPLFENPNQDTWPSIRKLLARNTETAMLLVSYNFSGSELEQETRNRMQQELGDFARKVVKRKASEAAEQVLHLMKVRYFSGLNDAAVKRKGMKRSLKDASTESLRISSLMAAMQLDEKPNQIEEILFSSFINGKECSKPLSLSTWPEVSPNDILITPMRCNSQWELFQADVLQATKDFLQSKGVMYGLKQAIIAAASLTVSIASLLVAIAALGGFYF